MNDRLTILLTNIWLAERGGSEVVVRDMALGLLRRGHRPIVYSPTLGRMADEIAERGISVIDDLRQLGEAPDIIHAHHSIPCGEALIRFPQVPALYVCHAFIHWVEAPAHFPQIGVYVAVDEACRDRLVHREGIDPQRVTTLHNAVDLERIPPRPRPLMSRPQRALAFGKAAAVPEIRIACEQAGIEYHAIGAAAGRTVTVPERELVNFDLVFASARSALEALCCGCAVIVCDLRGFAGLVTPQNFAAMRARNFGLRCLSYTVSVDRCVEEINAYDAVAASLVAQSAVAHADLGKLLDQFENIYRELLTGKYRPNVTKEAIEHATARFLHENLPRRPGDTRWPWLPERERLQCDAEAMRNKIGESGRRIDELQRELTRANDDRNAALLELENARSLLASKEAELASGLHARHRRRSRFGRLLRRFKRRPDPH